MAAGAGLSERDLAERLPLVAASLSAAGDGQDGGPDAGTAATADALIAGAVPEDLVVLPGAARVPERELVRTLRSRAAAPVVLAVVRVGATLLRALRDRPPALLVWCGPADPQELESLDTLPSLLLGPAATLRVGPGEEIVCAANQAELLGLDRALRRELGAKAIRLAIAPTPPWLDILAQEPGLRGRGVVGYVPRDALHLGWARWCISSAPAATLVPLGVERPRLEARAEGLEAAAAAQALERLTGPVFPAPRVLALLHRGIHRGDRAPAEEGVARDPDALALWSQARRALPLIGAAPGMEAPLADVPVDVPTAAFLAQRALLRARRRRGMIAEADERPPPPAADPELLGRSLEVLANSAEVLSEHESKVVLRGVDIEITRQAVASSASGAAQFAERIGFPVVLKALSPDLRRKLEVGAVELDLTNAAAVRRAYASIMAAVEARAPTARVDGVVVAEQIEEGLEINCGGLRTRDGAVVVYGQVVDGGANAEPALALAPEDRGQAALIAHAVLSRVPVPALRRASDPDPHRLADLYLRIAALFQHTGSRLLSVELGPARLVGGERGYVTLDARITQRPHLDGT